MSNFTDLDICDDIFLNKVKDGVKKVDDEITRLERLQMASSKPPELMRLCKELQQEIHSWGQLALPSSKANMPTPPLKEASRKILRQMANKLDNGTNLEEIQSLIKEFGKLEGIDNVDSSKESSMWRPPNTAPIYSKSNDLEV